MHIPKNDVVWDKKEAKQNGISHLCQFERRNFNFDQSLISENNIFRTWYSYYEKKILYFDLCRHELSYSRGFNHF